MKFSLMTEPQLGGSYSDLLSAASWAEEQGMVSFARSDHYYSSGSPKPATDAFATLGGLARETTGIRLCVLVTPITFRHPAVIAKSAATIDRMSQGRLDLGVGTGWMDLEHVAFGLQFPDWSERFERLGEALSYLRAAFAGEDFEGRYYRITARALPQPTGIRLIVGGTGKERTPRLAGAFADEYNHIVAPVPTIGPKIDLVAKSAAEHGRDPSAIQHTVMGPIVTGRDEVEYRANLGERARTRNTTPESMERRLRENGIPHGPPERLGEQLAGLEAAGVCRYYLQWLDLPDLCGLQATWEAVKAGQQFA